MTPTLWKRKCFGSDPWSNPMGQKTRILGAEAHAQAQWGGCSLQFCVVGYTRQTIDKAQQNSGILKNFFWEGVSQIRFLFDPGPNRCSGHINTTKLHRISRRIQWDQSRGLKPIFPEKKSLNCLIGVRIFLGKCFRASQPVWSGLHTQKASWFCRKQARILVRPLARLPSELQARVRLYSAQMFDAEGITCHKSI